ncbi:Na+/H+ antiporter subunit G [Aliishimia ponticola]|uniref:Na+/H+ antiporter subunit G n=1 Tax=Aliishimia ponticola TaxID=2499833 RepID=A0A4S4NC91_9RHOB|nr:Na+/H+ antiporter subunit G [Aliishimia ponticola]THH37032.1 Na+/H+ antiporter subunit G [Aliishimia ponticola]
MPDIIEIVISALLVIAGLFGLIGSYGMIKLRDTMQRLHAPTKATTIGIGSVLIASLLHNYAVQGHLSFHELLITLFLFLTAPITANFIAKTYMAKHVAEDEVPDSGRDYGWTVYDDPPMSAPDPVTDPKE